MKRNLMPLLGVAFVAAVAASGIFYGLLIPRLTAPSESRAAAGAPGRAVDSGPSLIIPAGKRAVTIHPTESGGVVAMLRPGSRVDIQVLVPRPEMELRRLLEDVEVLAIAAPEGGNGRPSITLLVGPEDSDRLSLADASMQVRLALRNPNDHALSGQSAVAPAALVAARAGAKP